MGGGAFRYDTHGAGGCEARLYSVSHQEEPYGGKATIRLKNSDKALSAKDWRGWETRIYYGYITAYGYESSMAAPLWVLAHHEASYEGQLLLELECVDVWQKFNWFGVGPDPDTGEPIWAPEWKRTLTIRQIINTVMGQVESSPAIPDVIVDSNDGIIDTFKPHYKTQMNLRVRKIIRDMLKMTKSGMRMRGDGMHILYLNPAESPCYWYDSAHAFHTEVRQKGLVIPNFVYFVDHYPTEDEAESFIGEAQNTESILQIGKIVHVERPPDEQGIESNAEATQLAEAYLARIEAEVNQGRILVPHNCGQELYDQIQVNDSRAGVLFEGRVGGLIHRYNCGEASATPKSIAEGISSYSLEIRLGGLVDALTTTSPDGLISDLWGLSMLHDWPGGVTPGTGPLQGQLGRAEQLWSTDLIFLPGNSGGGNKHNSVHWAAGTIFWPDGYTLSVYAGQVTNIPIADRVYIYWDLDSDPSTLKSSYTLTDVMGIRKGLLATVIGMPVGGIVIISTHAGGSAQEGGLAEGSVVTTALVDALVSTAKLQDGAVEWAKIADRAIREAKLDNVCVSTRAMQDAVVTKEKLQNQAVTHEKIVANAIYGHHVTAFAIAADHIIAGAISADKIAANAVIASLVAAENVVASYAWFNDMVVNRIEAGNISVDKLQVITELNVLGKGYMVSLSTGKIKGPWANYNPQGYTGVIWSGSMYMNDVYDQQLCMWFGDHQQVIGGRQVVTIGSRWPMVIVSYDPTRTVYVGPQDAWGPASDSPANWYFRTRNQSGGGYVDHRFAPLDDGRGSLGSIWRRWWEVRSIIVSCQSLYVTNPPWQHHDDVGILQGMRSKKVKASWDKRRTYEVIDPDSLPEAVRAPGSELEDEEDSKLSVGDMIGLTSGAIVQLAERVETMEKHLGIKGGKRWQDAGSRKLSRFQR